MAAASFWLISIGNPMPVSSASSELCPDELAYSATIAVPANETFTVYGRLGKSGQQEAARVLTHNDAGLRCSAVGQGVLRDDRWQKVGSIKGSSSPITLSLYSDALQGLPDANRPSLMLVPDKNPVCQPTTECYVTVAGAQGYVRPPGTLLNEDSLRVVIVRDPTMDNILRVDYYSGTTLAYSKSTLEPFDTKFLGDNATTISRVIVYESGQEVVLRETVETTYTGNFERFLFQQAAGNRFALVATASVVGVLIAAKASLWGARQLYARRRWKKLHVVTTSSSNPDTSGAQDSPQQTPTLDPLHYTEDSGFPWLKALKIGFYIVVSTAVVGYGLVLSSAYIIQPFGVDGESMETTLSNGRQMWINKTGKTWAQLNGNEYLPKRGEIIVYQKAQSSLALDPADQEYVVKRVIGLPGERIVVQGDTITVYNEQNPGGFSPDQGSNWERTYIPGDDTRIEITLMQSELFVVGDNRPGSVDSRQNGPITTSQIVGKVIN
jgi:signal peptidase I